MDPVILTQVVVQGLMLGAMYGLVSLGMTLIFSTSGFLNFAHGAFLAMAMYAALSLYAAFKLDPYLSVFITTPAFFALGWLLFRFIVARVYRAHLIMAAQTTLGMLWIIQSGLSTIYGNQAQSVTSFVGSSRVWLGGVVLPVPYIVSFASAALMGVLLYWVMQRTDFGRSVRAIMQNREAAALMGLNVSRTQIVVFGLGMALLGFSGPIISPILSVTPQMGLNLTLFAFMIMMFGGINNLAGSVVGGLVFGIVDSLARYFSTGYVAALIPYCLFVIVLVFRPTGLLGEK